MQRIRKPAESRTTCVTERPNFVMERLMPWANFMDLQRIPHRLLKVSAVVTA